jgi:hypothetical protein
MAKLWHPDGKLHLVQGRASILDPDGSVAWEEEDWTLNALADEGEESVLNVYLLEAANPTKYLALLTATPTDTTTMSTMTERAATNGYARQQITAGNWGAPTLNSGDFQSTAAEKTFGPVTTADWTGLTYIALVTTASGTGGKFILYLALSATTTVAVGQSFKYVITVKAQ